MWPLSETARGLGSGEVESDVGGASEGCWGQMFFLFFFFGGGMIGFGF